MKQTAISLLLLMSFFALCAVPPALSLNPFEPSTVDGRAFSMGRATLLGTQGAFTTFNNPAMMTRLQGIVVSGNIMASTGGG